jgi:arylsulfatase A-like enzyme
MSRKGQARILVGAVFILGCVPACGPTAATDPRPNILLITVDTLRADHLGTYGYPLETSPAIDAIANQGIRFDRAIAAASTTAPAHASIMTSLYTREHSIGPNNGGTKLINGTTLAEEFKHAGYATGAFVGNIMLQPRTGFDRGFDLFDGDLREPETNREFIFERTADETTERALQWLDTIGDQPFFLWVHYQDPHGPYTPPQEFAERLRVPPAPNEKPLRVLPSESGWGGIPSYQALQGISLPSEYESLYAGEILYADFFIGKLVESVEAHEPRRDAVILLTADHGESLGEMDRWFEHGFSTMPQLAHVPFILKAPGLAPGNRDETVSHVDVLPTLLELAGLPIPAATSGSPLGPIVRGEQEIPERYVYSDIGDEVTAYRGNEVIRVTGTENAWLKEPQATASNPPLWFHYVWHKDGTWAPTTEDPTAQKTIRSYVETAVPIKKTPAMELQDLERLRALGYVAE